MFIVYFIRTLLLFLGIGLIFLITYIFQLEYFDAHLFLASLLLIQFSNQFLSVPVKDTVHNL